MPRARQVQGLCRRGRDSPDIASLKLTLGRLAAGRYRLLVTVSASTGEAASAKVGFVVKR